MRAKKIFRFIELVLVRVVTFSDDPSAGRADDSSISHVCQETGWLVFVAPLNNPSPTHPEATLHRPWPSHVVPDRPMSSLCPSQVVPDRPKSSLIVPSRPRPSQVTPSPRPSQVVPGHSKSSQAVPSRPWPSQVVLGRPTPDIYHFQLFPKLQVSGSISWC